MIAKIYSRHRKNYGFCIYFSMLSQMAWYLFRIYLPSVKKKKLIHDPVVLFCTVDTNFADVPIGELFGYVYKKFP